MVFACITVIGRIPSAAVLQHLRTPEVTNQIQAEDSGNTGDTLAKQLDGNSQRDVSQGNLPMVIEAGLLPVSARLVKQIQSGQYIDLAALRQIEKIMQAIQLVMTSRSRSPNISLQSWSGCKGLLHCKNKSVVVTPNLGVKVLCTYDTLMGCHGP